MKVNKYLEKWTLSIFFSISVPQPSPYPSNNFYPDKSSWIFFFLVELPLLFGHFCLCRLIISAFPKELSRIPGCLAWDKGGWLLLHTQSPKIFSYCFVSPWLLLSKSAKSPGQNIWIWSRVEKITEGETRKKRGKVNQKVWHSFQPGPIRICGARVRKRDGFIFSKIKLGK